MWISCHEMAVSDTVIYWTDFTDCRNIFCTVATAVLEPPALLPLIQWKKERPEFLILNESAMSHICSIKPLTQNSPPPPRPTHGLERLSSAMVDFILTWALEPTLAVVLEISPLLLHLILGPSIWFLVDAIARVYYFWIFARELGYQKKASFLFL